MDFRYKMSNIINFNISDLFANVLNFYDNYHNNIVQYYTVESVEYPKESFEILKSLKKDVDFVLAKLNLYKGNFDNVGYWELLDQIDDIKQKLELIYAYPKFYKVSFVKWQNQKTKYESYVQKQNETIEQIASKFNEQWEDLAILNNFKEEDYTNAGGKKFILRSTVTENILGGGSQGQQINAICDICLGTNVLGKDLPNYFEIDEDEGDLKVRTPKDTFLYTVKRLFQLVQGSIPEFPSLGIAKDIISESVKGDGFFFPVLLRQLSESIQTDDTILVFSIDDIEKIDDYYLIKASVYDRLLNNLKFESSLTENEDEERGDEYVHIYENDIVGGPLLESITLKNSNAQKDVYLKSNTKWKVK